VKGRSVVDANTHELGNDGLGNDGLGNDDLGVTNRMLRLAGRGRPEDVVAI
jgi:hypothetical protein